MLDKFIQENDDGDFHNQLPPVDETHLKQQYVQSWLSGQPSASEGNPDTSQSGAYTVLQTVQRPGLCSDIYGTVH